MEGQDVKIDVPVPLSVEVAVLGREVASMSENVTDLLRSKHKQAEEIDCLKSKLANLEEVVADLIARNCLLMKPVEPVIEAGQSHSADAVV